MNTPGEPALFAMGGAHIDRRGQFSGVYVPGASNPGTMRETIGGGVFNAACTAHGRGINVTLLSARGGDHAGDAVASAVAAAGLTDLSATFLDRTTPSYTSMLDRSGEQIAGLADMALYDVAFARCLRRRPVREAIAAAHALLTDANPSGDALAALAAQAGPHPLFAMAISPAKVVKFAPLLPALHCLFMNVAEARALAGAGDNANAGQLAQTLHERGLPRVAITAGAHPVTLLDDGHISTLTPPPCENPVDVTGAGDAFAGATIAAMMHGLPLRDAAIEGLAASLCTLETRHTIASLSTPRFAHYLGLANRINTP